MFIVIKSEHYDCTNLICKKDTLEDAVAAVKGYFDPDGESSVDVSKQLIGFHYVVLKKKV